MAQIQDASIQLPVLESPDALTGTALGVAGAPLVVSPRKVMVIVHGAGSFPDDYYKPLVVAIEQRLGGPFNYIPVYYADITNSLTSVAVLASAESPAITQFKQDFMDEMQRSHDALLESRGEAGVTLGALEAEDVGSIRLVQIIVKEVADYIFVPNFATQIQERLIAGLDQAAQTYDEIVLATLSLGTLVAFDALKPNASRYKILDWFTTGSPLGNLRRIGARQSDLGAIQPANVARWFNLYDTNDVIASAIGPQFPGYRLYDVYVSVGSTPFTAHDYFNNGETLDMLADAMR